eukprot:767731-Hanusia_phi.AAC.2
MFAVALSLVFLLLVDPSHGYIAPLVTLRCSATQKQVNTAVHGAVVARRQLFTGFPKVDAGAAALVFAGAAPAFASEDSSLMVAALLTHLNSLTACETAN